MAKLLNQEPMVTISLTEDERFIKGERMPFSVANKAFSEANQQKGAPGGEVNYTVDFSLEGGNRSYNGTYYIGTETSDLAGSIQSYAQRLNDLLKKNEQFFMRDRGEKEYLEDLKANQYILEKVVPYLEQFRREDADRAPQPKEEKRETIHHKPYKGFANEKGKKAPTVLLGDSPDEIINRIQGWNGARKEEEQFITCNIGSLNAQTNRYENYHKYSVAEGKDISPIYLDIPRLNKEDFTKLTKQFKEAGARYNGTNKKWYITPSTDANFFLPYISSTVQRTQTPDLKAEQASAAIPEEKRETAPEVSPEPNVEPEPDVAVRKRAERTPEPENHLVSAVMNNMPPQEPEIPADQSAGFEKEQTDSLVNNQSIKEFAKLLCLAGEVNGVDAKQFEGFIKYIDSMDTQFEKLMTELQDIKGQFNDMQRHMLKEGVKEIYADMLNRLEDKVFASMSWLAGTKKLLIKKAEKAVETFKGKGVQCLNDVVTFLGMKINIKIFELRCTEMAQDMQASINKVNSIAREMRETSTHAKNIGRSITGKELLETPPAKESGVLYGIAQLNEGVKQIFMGAADKAQRATKGFEKLELAAARQTSPKDNVIPIRKRLEESKEKVSKGNEDRKGFQNTQQQADKKVTVER